MKVLKAVPIKIKRKINNWEKTYNFYSDILNKHTHLHFRDKLMYSCEEDDYILFYELRYKNVTVIQDYITLYRLKNDKMYETECAIFKECAKYEDQYYE